VKHTGIKVCTLAAIVLFSTGPLAAQDFDHRSEPQITLSYNAGSSKKLEQITGNCDWVNWDATITALTPTCKPTVSQPATRADVLGQGLGYSFEHNGKLIFLFGDTFGATLGHGDGVAYFPTWTNVQNPFQYQAGDTIAWSTTYRSHDPLLLNYFLSTDQTHALIVQPQYTTPRCFTDGTCGTALPMGPDNIPNSGISLDGQIYIVASTGTLNHDFSLDYSVLTKFDEYAGTFSAGRTISSVPAGGHFAYTALREYPNDSDSWNPGFGEPFVVIAGLGKYRGSNIYLSIVPKSGFESGAGTRYFTGLDKFGFPTWGTKDDASNVPIVTDVDPTNPTIGNLSLTYSRDLDLWLMTFDGGRGDPSTNGIHFTYARHPWGPWSIPQRIFNDCQDGALGNYIFYYYDPSHPATNACPSAVVPPANTSGPSGPTIGPQDSTGNPPATTRGGGFAPQMIERFTEIEGNTLKIYYTLSTWNPYTVVKMESDFTITRDYASSVNGGGSNRR
jgi:uncharacterized protein DUF4185